MIDAIIPTLNPKRDVIKLKITMISKAVNKKTLDVIELGGNFKNARQMGGSEEDFEQMEELPELEHDI